MPEEQQHGFAFQGFVRRLAIRLTGCEVTDEICTGKWDLPPEANPVASGGPISIKTARWATGIGFGDALRQFGVAERFTLIVGFWEWRDGVKRVVKVVAASVEPEVWQRLWHPIERADLAQLDAVVKDMTRRPAEARLAAQAIVARAPFTEAIITVNRKIDSKSQRRVQCSLTQAHFFTHLAPQVQAAPDAAPSLWGERAPLELPGRKRFGAR